MKLNDFNVSRVILSALRMPMNWRSLPNDIDAFMVALVMPFVFGRFVDTIPFIPSWLRVPLNVGLPIGSFSQANSVLSAEILAVQEGFPFVGRANLRSPLIPSDFAWRGFRKSKNFFSCPLASRLRIATRSAVIFFPMSEKPFSVFWNSISEEASWSKLTLAVPMRLST